MLNTDVVKTDDGYARKRKTGLCILHIQAPVTQLLVNDELTKNIQAKFAFHGIIMVCRFTAVDGNAWGNARTQRGSPGCDESLTGANVK